MIETISLICPVCNTVFSRRASTVRYLQNSLGKGGPFCSRPCARKAERSTKLRSFSCTQCGKLVELPKIRGRKYCSFKCSSDFIKNKNILEYLSGKHSKCVGKDGQTQGWFRDYIKEQMGWKCELCGWGEANPINSRIYVELDHIDGDCFNSKRDNLRVICPNCHTLTPNYKALNRGNSARTNVVSGMAKKPR